METVQNEVPVDLSRAMTLILMSLTRGPKHGYAIMTDIVVMTSGDYSVKAGTLYRSISQMLSYCLIEALPDSFDAEDDERRRYYRITSQGRQSVKAELERIEKLVQIWSTEVER